MRLKTGLVGSDFDDKDKLVEAVNSVYGVELVTFRKADYKLWASIRVKARQSELESKVKQVKEVVSKLGWKVYKETKRHRDWQRIYIVKESA